MAFYLEDAAGCVVKLGPSVSRTWFEDLSDGYGDGVDLMHPLVSLPPAQGSSNAVTKNTGRYRCGP